ncbi:hypothetical protein O3P69_000940 [Scylla paramamosain]|uniref:Uncharacterized protein n=1 Tax=Scylla paramamosain TaxID=85552 RepID=A0AAW0USF0_SCYPA
MTSACPSVTRPEDHLPTSDAQLLVLQPRRKSEVSVAPTQLDMGSHLGCVIRPESDADTTQSPTPNFFPLFPYYRSNQPPRVGEGGQAEARVMASGVRVLHNAKEQHHNFIATELNETDVAIPPLLSNMPLGPARQEAPELPKRHGRSRRREMVSIAGEEDGW